MQRNSIALFAALALFIFRGTQAQDAPTETVSPPTASDAAWEAASKVVQRGATSIALRDQAKLELPEGYGFIPKKEAADVMAAMGNQTNDRFIGMIVPFSGANWFVTVDYEPAGYIKDDDAKNWDAKELLQNLKEGTEAGNERREQMGIPALTVSRWIEPPAYDAPMHRLVWSIEARLKNGDDPDPTINYNTYVLGREGYIEMNLITTSSTVQNDKIAAHQLLEAVAFNEGKSYQDFNASTDKVAAYGLAALIGGVAAKKLGLLATLGVFFAKFAKVIAIAAVAFGAGIMKWFRGKKDGVSE
jgi:uncharacterized membrane-anchored protein